MCLDDHRLRSSLKIIREDIPYYADDNLVGSNLLIHDSSSLAFEAARAWEFEAVNKENENDFYGRSEQEISLEAAKTYTK
jgi:hypothetical protein